MIEKIGITIDNILTNDFKNDIDENKSNDLVPYTKMPRSFDVYFLTDKTRTDKLLGKSWFQKRRIEDPKIVYHRDVVQAGMALQLDYLLLPNYKDYVFPLRTCGMQIRREKPNYSINEYFDDITDRRSWSN